MSFPVRLRPDAVAYESSEWYVPAGIELGLTLRRAIRPGPEI